MTWVFCALLAAMIGVALALPLLRPNDAEEDSSDVDLYKRQIDEIDRDAAAGLLSTSEAEARRAETARRLIASQKAAPGQSRATPRLLAGIVALLVAGGALGLYGLIGAAGYPDVPRQARLKAAEQRLTERPSQGEMRAQQPAQPRPQIDPSYAATVEELRAVMAANPDDPRGLALLARHEAGLGNYEAAIEAQAHLIDITPDPSLHDKLILLDLLVFDVQGYVSPRAEALAREILAEDPRNTGARYYLALLYDQIDRPDIAYIRWREMVEGDDPSDSYVQMARRFVGQAARRAGLSYTPPERGPSQADMDAASQMSPEARAQMIEGMVNGLADRLAREGGPASDWARLINALGVLGQEDRARAIATEALGAFAADPDGLAQIEAAARQIGARE